jgi:hypothetical protein
VREWCEGTGMIQNRGGWVGCALITRGRVVYVGLGKVGPKEVLWLVG